MLSKPVSGTGCHAGALSFSTSFASGRGGSSEMGPSRLPRSVRDSELQVHTVEIPMLLYARTSLIVYSVCTNVHTHAEARRTTLGMPRT